DSSDIAADNGNLIYINIGKNNHIYRVDSQNNLTEINSAQRFQKIKWAGISFGVGQDNSGHLYVIANGSVKPLGVPCAYSGSSVSFDVSPNKRVYVSYGSDVYAGSQSGNFKK